MSYSNGLLSDQSYQTANKYGQRGLPGVGFKLTDTGDYDMQNKNLTNVKSGTDSNDAVNKSQLDATTNLLQGSRAGDVVNDKAVIYSNTGAVHANSLYIEDPPDQGNSNEVRIMTEHQSYPNIHLNIPDLHNFDGHGGRPKSELMVTSVEQTVTGKKVFENIEVHDPTSNNQAANKSYADTKLSLTGGTMTGDLILPHHNYPIPGNTNKVINYESQREIFLSRQESFPMQADINMNNNFIQNIATPTSSHQVTNKGYCDYNFLNRQKGGVLMGPLSMNRNDLTGIPDTPKFGYSAVNKNYVDGEIAKIPQSGGNMDTSSFVKLDGSRAMTGNLNMDNHKIENLNTPTNFTDAVNKQYIDETLLKSHLISSEVENAFKYLSDQDESSSERNIVVHGITIFNGSPHKKNKKAYNADLIYTTGLQYYDSKIGINLYSLPIGKYTVIMEYYFSEDININIFIEATHALVGHHQLTNFPNYKKVLVQINRQSKIPDYLFFTITGNGTTSTNPEIYLIFYGIKGWHNNIPQEIYDHTLETGMFEYDNGNMKIYHNIDMNNNQLKNLSDATDNNDAINKKQMDKVNTQVDINKRILSYAINKFYLEHFTYHFFDFKEPLDFKLTSIKHKYIILGIDPGLRIISSNNNNIGLTNFIKYGIKFNSDSKIILDLGYQVNQSSSFTLMISLILNDVLKFYFVESTHEQIQYYPVFNIDKTNSKIIIETISGSFQDVNYDPSYNNENILVMINHDNLIGYDIQIISANVLQYNPSIPVVFSTNKLAIEPGNNTIIRMGFQNQSILNTSNDPLRLILQEKKNGTYFG